MMRPGSAASSPHGPWACIDAAAIAWNLAWLKRRYCRIEPACALRRHRLWAVIKANAYGHGLDHALQALHDADGVAVGCPTDVLRLRNRGWTRPILLLSSASLDTRLLEDPAAGELHIVVDDSFTLERLEGLRNALPRVHAWLRYAGELRALGFDDADYANAFSRLHALAAAGHLASAGHLHHYARAEDPETLAHERQAFARITAGLPGPRCTGNSAALCSDRPIPPAEPEHWLRCGLALYGASPLPGITGQRLGLRPAMSLRARLLSIRQVKAGQAVGYGEGFRATRDTCIGVVGIGYSHGLPRHLWLHGSVLAGRTGRRVPMAGRIAMDCLTVDLGPRATEQPGEIMTVWGQTEAGETLPVETVADACDTIAAELLSGLTARVPLVALDGSAIDASGRAPASADHGR